MLGRGVPTAVHRMKLRIVVDYEVEARKRQRHLVWPLGSGSPPGSGTERSYTSDEQKLSFPVQMESAVEIGVGLL